MAFSCPSRHEEATTMPEDEEEECLLLPHCSGLVAMEATALAVKVSRWERKYPPETTTGYPARRKALIHLRREIRRAAEMFE
jgi:hypothetical protein